nr:MAG TPA: hypothetical protein [Caudoviricetes sp.]
MNVLLSFTINLTVISLAPFLCISVYLLFL